MPDTNQWIVIWFWDILPLSYVIINLQHVIQQLTVSGNFWLVSSCDLIERPKSLNK